MRTHLFTPLMGILLGGLLHAVPAFAQDSPPASVLIKEIAERSALKQNLEELCDGFGARMTGSPQLRTAQAWAMDKLKSYGAVNVHEEAYELGKPWQRGIARARLLSASGAPLNVVQMAWTAGTPGVVRSEVVVLNVPTLDQMKAALPAMKGKIVLFESGPTATPEQRKDFKAYKAEVNRLFDAAQFAAVLMVSAKENGLQDMWGGPDSRFKRSAGIITKEHANLLKRLIARGIQPRLEIEMTGGFGKKPVKAYNVVADIVGSESPQEIVILGAHQDSWDLGSGATDNGAGTVVMMEVLRAMQASGLKPKRTLRVVLFSGEEQGLLGSKAYAAAHQAELKNIQAVLVQDAGSGRISGFPDMKVDAWFDGLSAATAPARAVGPIDIVYGAGGGSDHATFYELGLPAFAPIQDMLDYRSHTIHSEIDSVDHVAHADLKQGAQVMAITAWGLLNGKRLPHQEAKQLQ
jgi:carboxypeptidase Q